MYDMKDKILNILKKIYNYIKNQIIILSKGECKSFYSMLYLWGLLPFVVISYITKGYKPILETDFISILIYLIFIIYFIWHIYVVKKTLKVQPQYKVKKISKKELYANKTKEEIKEIKNEKRKDTLKKLLLLKSWDSVPMYTIIELLDFIAILNQMQKILNIIDK